MLNVCSKGLHPYSFVSTSLYDPHVSGYGFHVENPDEVMQGTKPRLREVGPFIYKAVTVKDSEDFGTGKSNLVYNEDGDTLTYRAR